MPIWRSSTSSWSPPPRQGVADPSSVVDAQRRALLRRLRDAGSAGSDPAPRSRSRPASGARRYRARVHHRPPVHAELLGHLGDRPGELAGLPARLARALRVSTTCASRCSEVSVHACAHTPARGTASAAWATPAGRAGRSTTDVGSLWVAAHAPPLGCRSQAPLHVDDRLDHDHEVLGHLGHLAAFVRSIDRARERPSATNNLESGHEVHGRTSARNVNG
jgi:hypothetical protein